MAKKILIIDGGPRKKFNLAQLLESFTEGVKSVDASIEVEHVHLYDLDYKGCVSCLGCKLAGGKNYGRCLRKDGLSPVLEEIKTADGLAFGSPIYYMNITGEMQSALERIIFPYGSYNGDPSRAPQVPTAFFYTMNATPEDVVNYGLDRVFNTMDMFLQMTFGSKPERVCAYYTYQVRDYSKYDMALFPEPKKRQWREEHFAEDKQKAFQAGVNMANKILTL